MTNIHIKEKTFEAEELSVCSEGELVAVTIGHDTFKIHYSNAFTIAQWLRVRAKESQLVAQDTERRWNTLSEFDPELIEQKARIQSEYGPSQIRLVKRPASSVMSQQVVEVSCSGEIVSLSIGTTDIKFHYEQAFKISNMIRSTAKTVKRLNRDESRTMSVVGFLRDANKR